MHKIPIIIDCDPGVDDCFAIALAQACGKYDIKAITAVEGNVPAAITRKNALAIAELFQIDCKVAFGAELPLEKPYLCDASDVHGENGLGEIKFENPAKKPEEKPAWDVIYEEAVKAEGKLILFAIGPLTNIAMALRTHPDLPKYIDKFCIMGGGTCGNMTPYAEFNIFIDPTAAKEAIEGMETYVVGLDATRRSGFTNEEMDTFIQITKDHEVLNHLLHFARNNNFEENQDIYVIHDALALASMMGENYVQFKSARITVEGDLTKENNGETYVDFASEEPNGYFACEVAKEEFFALMKKAFAYYV